MSLKGLWPRSLLNRRLSSQLQVNCIRFLSTSLFRPSEAQDSQGFQNSKSKQEKNNQTPENSSNQDNKLSPKAKTVSEADAELRERLEHMSGEGGASGIEYEDGKPNAMKRSVRNNMFRII